MAQLAPVVGQVEPRLGQSPDMWLVDGGFPARMALLGAVWALVALTPARAQVVPDGSTLTTVSVNMYGRQIITPAAAKNDVSYNAFSRFDVSGAGASFANRQRPVRTIVSEVFSPLPSRIEGPVSVDGPRANLILANQNGIRVNDGSFVNFGSLALTTGELRLRDVALSPGSMQRYVDLHTRQGEIQIESGGLDANIIHLELNAKKIGLAGPISNAFTSASASTRMVAGDSDASFDTLASASDNLTPWMSYSNRSQASKAFDKAPAGSMDAIAIDITAGSLVRSGRVQIIVTDQGAGVRNAGTLTATSGDLRLTSTGQIEQIGGRMQAAGDVRIKSGSFTQSNDGERQSAVIAGLSTRIDAERTINNEGGLIQGHKRSGADTDTSHALDLNAGTTVSVSTPVGAKQGAVVFSTADDMAIRGKDGIDVVNARVVSNGRLVMESEQTLNVQSLHRQGVARQDWSDGDWLTRHSGFAVDRGQLADAGHPAYVVAEEDMTVRVGALQNIGGSIFSNAGQVDIEAKSRVSNRALAVGRFELSGRCFLFLCRQWAHSDEQLVGARISAATALRVKAGGTILNEGGLLLSVQQQEIEGERIIARGIPVQRALLRTQGLKALFGDTWARLYATDQGGGFSAQQGRLILKGATRQEGGFLAARDGVEGEIEVLRTPQRDPITIDDHLGILRW